MDVREMIKPLLHHSLMPLLVVIQVALATAIACNVLFLLQQRLAPLLAADGVGQPNRLIVVSRFGLRGAPPDATRVRGIEAGLHALPGVASASAAMSLPMTSNMVVNDVTGEGTRVKTEAAQYVGNDLVKTLGLQLVAGRDFTPGEERATLSLANEGGLAGVAIITRALARKLFPGENPLGRQIRDGDSPHTGLLTVVGVVAHLMRNDLGGDQRHDLDYSMLVAGVMGGWPAPVFGVRVAPGANVAVVLGKVRAQLDRELGPKLLPGGKPSYDIFAALRSRALAPSRAAAWLLAGVALVVLIVTFAGIAGLTSYWVEGRRREIGIRRALGARRRDIRRWLQAENLMVVGLGVLVGLLAAYGVNLWLMRHYALARLPWTWLPVGAAVLLVIGQLGVLWPAVRASRVPPVVAMRSL